MIKLSEINKEWYSPGELAKFVGRTSRTIQNHCDEGKIDFKRVNGRRNIPKSEVIRILEESKMLIRDSGKKDVIYARVSTSKQKTRGDLDRQISKASTMVVGMNPKNLEIISDVGSGLNDNRRGLNKLIDMVLAGDVDRIFVLYKDRLTRFGFNYLERICSNMGTKIIVLSDVENEKSIEEELAEDIVSIIHSFSGKLYGMRKTVKDKVTKELE